MSERICPMCGCKETRFISSRVLDLGLVEVWECSRPEETGEGAVICGKRWFYRPSMGDTITDIGRYNIEKNSEQIEQKAEEDTQKRYLSERKQRYNFKKQIKGRLASLESKEAQLIHEILLPSRYRIDEWEIGFLQSVSLKVSKGEAISEKQLARLADLLDKTKWGRPK